jgi:hypothetical protein
MDGSLGNQKADSLAHTVHDPIDPIVRKSIKIDLFLGVKVQTGLGWGVFFRSEESKTTNRRTGAFVNGNQDLAIADFSDRAADSP